MFSPETARLNATLPSTRETSPLYQMLLMKRRSGRYRRRQRV